MDYYGTKKFFILGDKKIEKKIFFGQFKQNNNFKNISILIINLL